MKFPLPSAFLFLGVFGLRSLCAAADSDNLTLPEDVMPQLRPVIEQAMRQAPRLLEKQLDVVQSQASGYMLRASSLPSAGGFVQYQWQRETRADVGPQGDVSSTNDKFFYNFSVNQSVWQWGALEASRKIARIERNLAQMNYSEAYRDLAAEIRANYLGLVLARLAVRNAEHVLRMAEENLKRQQARYNANQLTYGQIMHEQLRVDDASLALRRTRADFDFALSSFRSLTGDAQFAESAIPETIAEVPQGPALANVVGTSAEESAAQLKIAEQEVEKAKLGLVGPSRNLWPKLGLIAGASREEISRDLSLYNRYQIDTWYVGAQINWQVFDGLSTKGQKLEAYARLRRAEHRLANLKEALGRSLERERLEVGFSWEAYQNAKLRLRMAREGFDYTKDLFARGEASQEQVDNSQGNVNANLHATQSALAAHLNANVRFLSSQGRDPLAKSPVQP